MIRGEDHEVHLLFFFPASGFTKSRNLRKQDSRINLETWSFWQTVENKREDIFEALADQIPAFVLLHHVGPYALGKPLKNVGRWLPDEVCPKFLGDDQLEAGILASLGHASVQIRFALRCYEIGTAIFVARHGSRKQLSRTLEKPVDLIDNPSW